MQPIIRNAIARIDLMQQGKRLSHGTGFLVAGDLVLTAMHVVADTRQPTFTPNPGEIVLTFPTGSMKASVLENYWDPEHDWALLRCETAPDARPLPLAEQLETGAEWETYGFPEDNPLEGLVNSGKVSNHEPEHYGIQLFSEQASAGQGGREKGLSGSPVLVQNAVVGLLRFALMTKEAQSVEGTVYACPIAQVLEKAGELLPLPDPCYGLPGLPKLPLPKEPFRHLAWFTAKEAEVFFGRDREIGEMYRRLTADDAAPVVLLYGQAGVGKSSFLDAGLLPRLRWYNQVCYLRRDPGRTLLQTLRETLDLLGGEKPAAAGSLHEAWLEVEKNGGKPLVAFFDQIEELFTHPNAKCPSELEEFSKEIASLFDGTVALRGKLVLSFRKEWFPEIQKQMEVNGLSYEKFFMESLGRAAVMEAITGVKRTRRLQDFYRLTIEPDLETVVADDLVEDRDSPIAPALQILLTKMWAKATELNRSAPVITRKQYEALKKEGLLLGDFLDQQLDAIANGILSLQLCYRQTQTTNGSIHGRVIDPANAGIAKAGVKVENVKTRLTQSAFTAEDGRYAFADLPQGVYSVTFEKEGFDTPRHPNVVLDAGTEATLDAQLRAGPPSTHAEWVESGLALNVVAFHTTPMLTAKERSLEELGKTYQHRAADIPPLVQEMQQLFLLSDASQDNEQRATRLCHDTLAPLVRQRYDKSDHPGQRARRIIESRMKDWVAGSESGLLDAGSLANVERGKAGMRLLNPDENEFVAASRTLNRKRQRLRSILWAGAAAAVVFIAVSAVYAEWQSRQATQAKNVAELRYSTAEIANWLPNNPVYGLVLAIHAVGRSQQILGYVSGEVIKNLETAMETARDRLVLKSTKPTERTISADISSDGVIALARGGLEFWSAETGKKIEELKAAEMPGHCSSPKCVIFSPDDKLIAIAGDGGILLWTRDAHRGQVIFPGKKGFLAMAFSPHSHTLTAITVTGAILRSGVEGQPLGESRLEPPPEGFQVAAIAFDSDAEGFIAAAGTDTKVYVSDFTGKLTALPFVGHRHPVTSIAIAIAGELAVASGDQGGNLLRWNRQGQLLTDPNHLHSTAISALAFSPQGDMLATAGNDNAIHFLTGGNRDAETAIHGFPSLIRSLEFSADGNRLAAISDADTRVIDTYGIRLRAPFHTRDLIPKDEHPSDGETQLSTVAVGSRQTVAVAERGGTIIIWHPPSGFTLRIEPAHPAQIAGLVFSADESIFMAGSRDGELRVWDQTGKPLGEPWQAASWTGLFSFDLAPGGQFVVTADGQSLRLWNTQTHGQLQSISDDTVRNIDSVKFLSGQADEMRFATASGSSLQFWAIRSNQIEKAATPGVHFADSWTVFLNPSDKAFIAGNKKGQIELLGADGKITGGPINPHDSHQNVLGAIAFPDGETTASFIRYGQDVTFCRFAHGEACSPIGIGGHQGSVSGIALSPDSKILVSVGDDATVRLLRGHWTTWLEAACDRLKYHPIFQDAGYAKDLDPKVVEESKGTCSSMVWDAKQ